MTPPVITVSIVEDDDRLRNTMERYLGGAQGFCCVSAYGNAEDALQHLPTEQPEVVLMDINLPGMNGIQCVAALKIKAPTIKVIMLTVYEDPDQVFQALAAGAFGYLVKSLHPASLLDSIREVHEGGSPMSGNIARKVVQSFHKAGPAPAPMVELSQREREVLDLLTQGFAYKQIAEQMGISMATVRTYIQRIYEKLHVHSRTEAVVKYLQK